MRKSSSMGFAQEILGGHRPPLQLGVRGCRSYAGGPKLGGRLGNLKKVRKLFEEEKWKTKSPWKKRITRKICIWHSN